MKKRLFLMGACSAVVAPQALGAKGLPSLGAAARSQHWRQYLDQSFEAHAEGRSWPLTLTDVSTPAPDPHSEQFVLGFRAGKEMRGGLYELRHASGTRQQVYLGGADVAQPGHRLRVEFNLLHQAG